VKVSRASQPNLDSADFKIGDFIVAKACLPSPPPYVFFMVKWRGRRGPSRRAGEEQLAFDFRQWGGSRRGAGRKRRGKRQVSHGARPVHSRHQPLHITLRVVDGLPSLRGKKPFRCIKRALALANTKGKHCEEFRVTHFSVQGNHAHLIAEASDRLHLSRGMQGLAIRVAKRVNRALERRGAVFAERFHARALRTPREVRHALAYVLLNERRHLKAERGLTLPPWYFDPCSSASEFDGWRHVYGLAPPPEPVRDVTAPPRTFLLCRLWRRHGLIVPDEVPGAGQ
jgi:REP element-mobilizing transposase RayT